MAGINKVILVGNLGQDPEVRYSANGNPVANFSMATSESWNDKEGQRQERTEWHRIVAWGKLAGICGEYLTKGRQAYVEGKLQTRSWEDREGRKRYTTEVVASQVLFLGNREGASAGDRAEVGLSRSEAGKYDYGPPPMTDEDVPF